MSTSAMAPPDRWEYRADDAMDVRLGEWNAKHDLINELIPFEYRYTDPVAVLRGLRRGIDDLPVTKATFTLSSLYDDDPELTYLKKPPREFQCGTWAWPKLVTAWPIKDNTRQCARYANPNYLHATAAGAQITDPDERREVARYYAMLGYVDSDTVAKLFGVTPSGFRTYCQNYDVPWAQMRHNGRKRFGRTIEVIYEWTDYNWTDIAEMFGTYPQALTHYRPSTDTGIQHDFDVPADPSRATWFNPASDWRQKVRDRGEAL